MEPTIKGYGLLQKKVKIAYNGMDPFGQAQTYKLSINRSKVFGPPVQKFKCPYLVPLEYVEKTNNCSIYKEDNTSVTNDLAGLLNECVQLPSTEPELYALKNGQPLFIHAKMNSKVLLSINTYKLMRPKPQSHFCQYVYTECPSDYI